MSAPHCKHGIRPGVERDHDRPGIVRGYRDQIELWRQARKIGDQECGAERDGVVRSRRAKRESRAEEVWHRCEVRVRWRRERIMRSHTNARGNARPKVGSDVVNVQRRQEVRQFGQSRLKCPENRQFS